LTSSANTLLSSKEEHERHSKLWGGYAAFVAALLVATMATSNSYPHVWIVISLLALSLPSLVAQMLLDFVIRVTQGRRASYYRGLSLVLGFFPSFIGITIIIGHFSVIGCVLFVLLTIYWFLVIDVVTYYGFRGTHPEI
jgi:hypothetical protein